MIEALHIARWIIYIATALTGTLLGICMKKNGFCLPYRKDNFLSLGSLGDVLLGIFLSYGFVLCEFEQVYAVTPFLCFSACATLILMDDSIRNRLIHRFMSPAIKELVDEHIEESTPEPEPVPEAKPEPKPVPVPEPVPQEAK